MGWLQTLLDFIRQFWPFQIVYSYQKGIRFINGRDTAELEPGLYMFVPFFSHIETVNVKPDILRLENQILTTKDGVGISISANIAYEIVDARASFVAVQQVLNNLADECRSQLATRIREYDFPTLLADQTALEEVTAEGINDVSEDWGIVVERVRVADFIRTKSLSLTKV